MVPSLVYSPVKHRYALAATRIPSDDPVILDVGGYRSRAQYLKPFFRTLTYTAVNIGSAWYKHEEVDCLYNGADLPFRTSSFPFVISVDCIEHVPLEQRSLVVSEIMRVASTRAVIVVPISHGNTTNEERFLTYSERFGIEPKPSLLEHVRAGLPSVDELSSYMGESPYTIEFATPSHLYWSFQFAMLINTAVLADDAETLNRRIYDLAEHVLEAETGGVDQHDAYRAIIVVDR